MSVRAANCINCSACLSNGETPSGFYSLTCSSRVRSPLTEQGQGSVELIPVSTAVSTVYHFQTSMDETNEGDLAEQQPICYTCYLVLSDLYRTYTEFNQLREKNSYLAGKLRENKEKGNDISIMSTTTKTTIASSSTKPKQYGNPRRQRHRLRFDPSSVILQNNPQELYDYQVQDYNQDDSHNSQPSTSHSDPNSSSIQLGAVDFVKVEVTDEVLQKFHDQSVDAGPSSEISMVQHEEDVQSNGNCENNIDLKFTIEDQPEEPNIYFDQDPLATTASQFQFQVQNPTQSQPQNVKRRRSAGRNPVSSKKKNKINRTPFKKAWTMKKKDVYHLHTPCWPFYFEPKHYTLHPTQEDLVVLNCITLPLYFQKYFDYIGHLFEMREENNTSRMLVKQSFQCRCKLCGANLSVHNTSANNYRRHLSRSHSIGFDDYNSFGLIDDGQSLNSMLPSHSRPSRFSSSSNSKTLPVSLLRYRQATPLEQKQTRDGKKSIRKSLRRKKPINLAGRIFCRLGCGKHFSTPSGMSRHLKEQHSGIKPFSCEYCQKTFSRRDHLNAHFCDRLKQILKPSDPSGGYH